MPHLPPIEIIGGSVSIKFPTTEGPGKRIKHDGEAVHNPNDPPDKHIKLNLLSDADVEARIYLIEIKGGARSRNRKFAPLADGLCSIKIHYVSGEKAPGPDGDTTPLD